MQYLKELEDSILIDMLAQYTERFTHLFRNYTGIRQNPEYQNCKETIQYIILELYERGMLSQDTLQPMTKHETQFAPSNVSTQFEL